VRMAVSMNETRPDETWLQASFWIVDRSRPRLRELHARPTILYRVKE